MMYIQARYTPRLLITHYRFVHAHLGLGLGLGQENEIDPELIPLIKSYPVHTNPTPYELLNVSYHSFDEKTLKANFNKFAKLYHPDIKISHPLLENKTEKFHKILSAYKLLKNPNSKTMYDQYKIGWENATESTYDTFKASPNFKEYQYYSAGTWEDFQHMKNGSPKQTLDLEKAKYQILAGVIAVMIIAAVIESIGIKEMSEKESIIRSNITLRSKKDLERLYQNYGYGSDKDSRIKRFLWWKKINEILFNAS